MGAVEMGDVKHLVVAKFKEGADVDEIVKGMQKLVSEIDVIKSFEWGRDVGSQELLSQGFTHVFLMTFGSSEDLAAYIAHSTHVEFAAIFSAAIEKIMVFDFPTVVVKAPA